MEACPCCGYRTLYAQSSFELCPICLWTDDGSLPDEISEANGDKTLASAQILFAQHDCIAPEEAYQARAPTPQDTRPEGWQTLEERTHADRVALISKIQDAFAGVQLEDGLSINMAEYYDSCDESLLEDAKRDESQNWQCIPDELIDRSSSALHYTDAKGFRFYIPAYMVFTLKHFDTPLFSCSHSFLHTIGALNPLPYHKAPFHQVCTLSQKECMIDFLQFFSRKKLDEYPKYARKNHALFIEYIHNRSHP